MDKDYFDERLLFIGFEDFNKRKETIKSVLHTKDKDDVYFYRMYVYSRPFIGDTYKDYIWDYLQGDIDNFGFALAYSDYRRRKHLD